MDFILFLIIIEKFIVINCKKSLKMSRKKWLSGVFLLAILLFSYWIIGRLDEKTAFKLSVEDGVIEYLSSLFFFIAALISFYHFFVVKSVDKSYFLRTRKNYLILLLGLFFLFCAGEEISWGQRILGIETPEYMLRENAQKEFNFHNLYIFQGTDKDLNEKSGIQYWFTGHKLFAYFWITFCILIPVVAAAVPRIREFLRRIYFPLMPLWMGILFLVNHFASKICEGMNLFSGATPIVETKETLFAFLFMVSAVFFCFDHKKQLKSKLL